MSRESVTTTVIKCDACLQIVHMTPAHLVVEVNGREFDVCPACSCTASETMIESMEKARTAGVGWTVEDYGKGIWYATREKKCPACHMMIHIGDPCLKGDLYGWAHQGCIE